MTAPLVWDEIAPSSGHYAIGQGDRYAVLASVSRDYSLTDVTAYLAGHGWRVTYAWEQGTATRDAFAIDAWLASLPADPTPNHRWVYGEADRLAGSATLGQAAPWPFTFFHLVHVFRAVPAPPGSADVPPVLPPANAPAASSGSSAPALALIGLGVGVLGALAWRSLGR
jgi:hypothetical protein